MQTNNKLREALIKIRNLTEPSEGVTEIELIINDIAMSALAEPVRNCDVGSVDEQAERMDMFCKSHGHGFDGQKCYACENCKFISVDRCELAWAQMPYKEGDKNGN